MMNVNRTPPRTDYFDLGHGCAVQFDPDAQPYIQWTHIDGPVLHLRNATLRWLTLWERFLIWIGSEDARSLERKYEPEFVRRWEARAIAERVVDGALVRNAGRYL